MGDAAENVTAATSPAGLTGPEADSRLLRDLTSPRALVVRDGIRRRIAGREVVRGDLVVLSEGDRLPADATLVDDRDLHVNESLLTGESVPVRKRRVEAGHQTSLAAPFTKC